MYPFITLWWRHIEMTGLWFIVWLIVFCIVCYIRSKQMNISFWDMFYGLPTMIAIIYFTGSYTYFILNTRHFIPQTIIEISQIIIPPSYNFHAGWLILGMIISLIIFIYQKPSGIIRKKRIDCLFISYMNGLIIFWLFLVLYVETAVFALEVCSYRVGSIYQYFWNTHRFLSEQISQIKCNAEQ